MSINTERSTLYLVGFRIDPDVEDPQIYTIYVDDDRPILYQGRPIFFARPELAPAALRASDCGAAEVGPAPTELYTVCDIATALYTLNERDEEEEGNELLDCINILLDLVNCTGEPMPASYRATLETLADQLTFNKPFGEFLKSQELERQAITDAIYWALGMIVYHMKLVSE